jgi:hypothetical protein
MFGFNKFSLLYAHAQSAFISLLPGFLFYTTALVANSKGGGGANVVVIQYFF